MRDIFEQLMLFDTVSSRPNIELMQYVQVASGRCRHCRRR